MKKQGFLLFLSVAATAIFSTAFAFFLFQKFSTPQQVYVYEKNPVQFANFKSGSTTIVDVPEGFVSTSNKVTPAVVNITGLRSGYRASTGSGVVISPDGYIITNYHVIEDAGSYNVTLNDKQDLQAKLIGADPTTDLALLKVNARNLTPIEFGDSDEVQTGEWVLAVGNPFNLASTVTAGIVSAKGRNINIIEGEYSIESFIQTDAVVNPGNSGGALVNTNGQLVGINTAILSETGGYEGYSFAIPSNLVKKVINDLKDYGEVKRAILGVSIMEVNAEMASDLDLPNVGGVYVRRVNPGSSAEDAGLRSGDVITRVNGKTTASVAELQEQVARYRPGENISLEFFRDGKKQRRSSVRLKSLSN